MNRIQPIAIVTIALITLPYRAVAQPEAARRSRRRGRSIDQMCSIRCSDGGRW
jgi:hypothetical protein